MKSHHLECTVTSNSVALIFMVSRVFGTAPLWIERHHAVWIIGLSSMQTIYSYILMISLNVVMLAALVRDLNEDSNVAIRTRTPVTKIVWAVEVAISLFITCFEMSTGKNRFKQIIKCFIEMDKVIPKKGKKSKAYKECCLIVFCLIYLVAIILVDFLHLLYESILNDRDWTITLMYSAHYGVYMIIITLELQFVVIVLLVRSSIKSLNDSLHRLLLDTKSNKKKRKRKKKIEPLTSVNLAIDTIPSFDGIHTRSTATNTDHETLRHLSLAYSTICNVLREINANYGLMLLLILCQIPMHLVLTLYYFFIGVLNQTDTQTLMLLLIWSILHVVNLLIIVEPCDQTKEEMNQMRALVCQLMRVGSTCSQLSNELRMFSKQIVLNNPQYSALGFFILDRQFVATIVGGLITYLVIIIQFEHFSVKNDNLKLFYTNWLPVLQL